MSRSETLEVTAWLGFRMVGDGRLELPTSTMSTNRIGNSINRLRYFLIH